MITNVGFIQQLLLGTKLTLIVAVCALCFGLLVGLLSAILELSSSKIIRIAAITCMSLIRGLPELLVLFAIYFGGTILLSKIFHHYIEVNALIAGIVALGLIFAAYAAEVFRGAFLAINSGQKEAGMALGFSNYYILTRIQLPQLWRHALPGLNNLWLVLLKDTALVSLLGLADLMSKTQIAASETHQPFTFYCVAALIYLALTSISQMIASFCIPKLTKQR